MKYKFYIKVEEETYGPYSAREVRDLQLMDDILVTEESMSEWLPAGRFDFDDMARKELETLVNEDGTINRSNPLSTSNSNHNDSDIENIKGWNWGAFFFSWLWGVCNGVYWSLLLIIVNFIPYLGGILSLVGCIVLGIKGNEWAWTGKSWSSVEAFKNTQRKWAIAILWVLGISFALGILGGILGSM